jgi:FKBP-type peptidyl-prolyl cis-trans isomerase (trigger factor)
MGGFKRNKKALSKRELQERVGDQADNAVKMVQGLATVVQQQLRNLKLETQNLAAMSIMRDDVGGKITEKSIAYIDFIGAIKNDDGTLGDYFEGGRGVGMFVDMEVHQFLPDFQKALIGAQAGQELTFDVKFPENYGAKEIAGKTAQFEVMVRKVLVEIPSRIAERVVALDKEAALKKAADQAAAQEKTLTAVQ